MNIFVKNVSLNITFIPELLKCEYYTTSESNYFRDYFEFENITQVHFYSLSQNQIKFRLTDDIHSEEHALQFGKRKSSFFQINIIIQKNPFLKSIIWYSFLVIGERFEQSTCCDINGSQKTEIFAKSYIQRPNNSELKTLITPEIIRVDQPNEISVAISEGIL